MRARTLLLVVLATAAVTASGATATAFRVTLPDVVITGQFFDFTVEAIDGTGAVDSAYTDRVTFSSNNMFNMFATLPPDYTFTVGDAGVHVFSAKLFGEGCNRPISVFQLSDLSISGSDTTTVQFGPDDTQRFVITAPETADIGVAFNFTVTAVDMNFQPTGNYVGTVHFEDSGLIVPPDTAFTPADNGVKTFSATPDRGGHVIFNVKDVDFPAISDTHTMEIACPGFTVSASNDGPVCPGQRPTLTATTSEPGVQLEWQGARLFEGWGPVVQGVADWAGTYSVTMSLPNGCRAYAETEVTLSSANPQVSVNGSGDACDGVEQTFSIADADGPYSNIEWNIPSGGTIVSGQGTSSIVVRSDYDENGPTIQRMRVFLSATNGHGCNIENRAVEDVEIYPQLDLAIDTPSSACAGTTYTAHAVVSSDARTPTYQWSITNGTITFQAGNRIDYTVSGPGEAVITVSANNGDCPSTISKTVTPGGPSATIATDTKEICPGESISIPVTLAGAPPFTVHWSDGHVDRGIHTNTFTRVVTPASGSSYSAVSLSDSNCSGTGSGSVDVMTRETPLITQQPANAVVPRGSTATLTVGVEPEPTHVQWYRGLPGDQSHPIDGANSLVFKTPPIAQNTTFWAEIETSCGTTGSSAATVKVESRRRSARHP